MSLTAVVTGNPTTVRVETRSGATFPLALIGPDTYQVNLPASTVLAGYQQQTGHNAFGFLDIFDGATRTIRFNLSVNVRDAAMPDVDITPLSSAAQRSAHVVNLRRDALWISGSAPPDTTMTFYSLLPDNFDFVGVVSQVNKIQNRTYVGVRNTTQGIGVAPLNSGSFWGSPARLQGVINYPNDNIFDLGETGTNHEIGHRWINFLDHPSLAVGTPHWPVSDFARGIMGFNIPGGNVGGQQPYNFVEQIDGTYLVQFSPLTNEFSELELYLMGLGPAADVPGGRVFLNQNQGAQLHPGGILQGPVDTVTIDEIIASDGQRVPAYGAAQTDFRMATIVLSSGRLLTGEEMAFFDYMAARGEARTEIPYTSGLVSGMTKPFFVATKGRGTLHTAVANDIVLSKQSAAVSEFGPEESFTVVLTSPPASNVVLSITSADASEVSVEPTSLTFTPANWSTPQTVTIRGVDDQLVDGTQMTSVTVGVVPASSDDTYDLSASRIISVTTSDDDASPPTVASTIPPLAGAHLAAGAAALQVAFSEPVTGADVAANFELRSAGPDGQLGSGDDAVIPLSVNYIAATSTLTFPGLATGAYRLTVKATIKDGDGSRLDGDGNGGAGGDWSRDFNVISAGPSAALTVVGTPAADTILIEPASGSLTEILVNVNGVPSGPYSPSGAISVYGLQGNDSLTVSPDVYLPAVIDGGAGADTLRGGSGNDKFFSREGELDSIHGGLGIDQATTDSVDKTLEIETQNPIAKAPDNDTLHVKVLVINFDPLVPSEGNRRLYEIFNWNNPRHLAAGYEADMERASGGAIEFDIVEWRDLNEIPAFSDGFRYTPDEYVQKRRAGSGWHEGSSADFPRIVAEQNIVPLIDGGQVDELWLIGDHFFYLPGESWMAGPGAFFINGHVPGIPTQRAFASMGFSYERGWAEMLHNMGHRTEFTMNRFHGSMNLANPTSNWSKFSANAGQCWFNCPENIVPHEPTGIGTTHRPANAAGDYDTGNPRVVQSWADDFLNFPNLTGATIPVSSQTWANNWSTLPSPDFERDYQRWYFSHLPRAPGVNATDQRQNNWWKYLYDFNNYAPTGQPLPLSAKARTGDIFNVGQTTYTFTVAYSGAVPVNIQTLGNSDLLVLGPNGFSQAAELVGLSDSTNDTYVVATYRVAAPGGTWDPADRGVYSIRLKTQEVRDALGASLPEAIIGAFTVRTAAATELTSDADTSLLLHFNQSLAGAAGETPSLAMGESYTAGRLADAVQWTGGRLQYSLTDNVNAAAGTVEFWLKPSWSPNQGNYRFFQIGNAFNNSMLIGVDGANNLRFIQWGDDPATPAIETGVERGVGWGISNWTANTWRHVAATWDRASGVMALYVDGQPVGTAPTVGTSAFAASDLIIGSAPGGALPSLSAFDELRISTRARSSAEIAADYRAGLQMTGLTVDLGGSPIGQGRSRQFKATVSTDSGQSLDVTRQVDWSSSAAEVVAVGPDGVARALAAGNSQITASLDTLSASQSILISTQAAVDAQAVTGSQLAVHFGDTYQDLAVSYSAPSSIDAASLTYGDLRIVGPRGFSAFPVLVNAGPTGPGPLPVTYRFTPPGGYWDPSDNGAYRLELIATHVKDAIGNFNRPNVNLATFQVTVGASAFAPAISAIEDQLFGEDFTVHLNLSLADRDTPPAALSVSVSSSNDSLLPPSSFTVQGAGSNRVLQIVPAANQSGAANVTVQVSDGIKSATETLSITVVPLNDPPTFALGQHLETTDESGPQQAVAWATAIAAGPPDEAAQPVYFTASADNPNLFAVQPQIDAAGKLSYQPAPNATGTATITVSLWEAFQPGRPPNDFLVSLPHTFTIAIAKPYRWYNARHRLDVNDSREADPITALDVLLIFNALNNFPRSLPQGSVNDNGNFRILPDAAVGTPFYYDTSRDNFVTALDALLIINALNAAAAAPEGEAATPGAPHPPPTAATGHEAAPQSVLPDNLDELIALLAMDTTQKRSRQPNL
jgi:hypothetical protein